MNPLLDAVRECPLVASVQASEGSPVDLHTLRRLAEASVGQGVRALRLEGVEAIREIRDTLAVPTIGLIKRRYPGTEAYITPTEREIDELLATGCEAVALDGTPRPELEPCIGRIHAAGRLAMADCDTVESAVAAARLGADLIGTTLAGYTSRRAATEGPDLELLREVRTEVQVPVLAEGRYAQRWQVEAALRIGAAGVVVGGALNDPVKLTRLLLPKSPLGGSVGAVDIGGTWIRFGVFQDGVWRHLEREPLPEDREARLGWMWDRARRHGVVRLGVGTGGVVDPATGEVWDAKPIIPDHRGSVFSEATLGVPAVALNDGLATAWGHACHPRFAGKRVATMALGTGVGCGFVSEGRVWMGARGEPPRLNDLPAPGGFTYEELLGGAALSPEPSRDAKTAALKAFFQAGITLQEMLFPDEIVVCGAVGLSDWMAPFLRSPGLVPSPLGAEAGLFGAAMLALYPPPGIEPR
jgi:N-acetylmannosamine-6-phosphate 2-epimerase / N-acetylmannosamine kinase